MENQSKFVKYEDIQEALRLTAEAASKQDHVVDIPTSHGPYKMDMKPLALAVVENFAASLKRVVIVPVKPFKGQAWVDMAVQHAEYALQLLSIARSCNDPKQRADALADAHHHLDDALKAGVTAALRVREELAEHPGKQVQLSDDFDVKTTHPILKG